MSTDCSGSRRFARTFSLFVLLIVSLITAQLTVPLTGAQNPNPSTPVVDGSVPPARLAYPDSKPGDTVDDYFGTKVSDPYRWLEDDRAPAVILIRIDTNSGHGASSTTKSIEQTADIYSFLMWNLGVTPK